MKTLFPHIFYISVLLAVAVYLCSLSRRENEMLNFLTGPNDETYFVLGRMNQIAKDYIDEQATDYINPHNLQAAQNTRLADSLAHVPLTPFFTMEHLRHTFSTMVDWDQWIAKTVLPKLLPPQTSRWLWPDVRFAKSRNDSLRIQLALASILQFYQIKVTPACNLRMDPFSPAVSVTTLCAPLGQPVEADIFLGAIDGKWKFNQISINGHPVLMKEDVGRFQYNFDTPGVYPIKVQAKVAGYGWPEDSVITTEKTFFLHVNP